MEIYQLRALLAVARCGHLTRAAEQLHLTQPAVSKQIKALEDELGVVLFERTPFGMTLTKSGQILLPLAEATLTSALKMKTSANALRGEVAGTVRLGTIIDPESLGLGAFLSKMLQYYPLVEIKLIHGISGWVMEHLQAGDVDAGYYLGNVTAPGIASLELRKVSYVIVSAPQWAEQVRDADLDTLARMPWIGTPAYSSQNALVKAIFAERRLTANVVIEADQESSMIDLVKTGVGLCLMREELARPAAQRGEIHVWEGATWPCSLSFIYAERRTDEVLTSAMLQILRGELDAKKPPAS